MTVLDMLPDIGAIPTEDQQYFMETYVDDSIVSQIDKKVFYNFCVKSTVELITAFIEFTHPDINTLNEWCSLCFISSFDGSFEPKILYLIDLGVDVSMQDFSLLIISLKGGTKVIEAVLDSDRFNPILKVQPMWMVQDDRMFFFTGDGKDGITFLTMACLIQNGKCIHLFLSKGCFSDEALNEALYICATCNKELGVCKLLTDGRADKDAISVDSLEERISDIFSGTVSCEDVVQEFEVRAAFMKDAKRNLSNALEKHKGLSFTSKELFALIDKQLNLFSSDKQEVLKTFYPTISDPENFDVCLQAISFFDREKVRKYVTGE